MAWWDHEELKSLENRSDRYVLVFPEEYDPEYVRRIALNVLNYKNPNNPLIGLAEKHITYGLRPGEKPRFRIKARTKKN